MTKRLLFSCVLTCMALCLSPAWPTPTMAQTPPPAAVYPAHPPMPEARVGGAAVRHGGKVYYVGGVLFKDGRFAQHATTLLSFAPGTGKWSVEAEVPGRDSMGAAIIGEEIFFAGGSMDGGQLSDRHYSWNMVTRKLRERAPLPGGRNQHATAELMGRIYVAGGGTFNHRQLEFSRMLFTYDPASDTWTRKADMPIPMRNLCLVPYQGKLYAIGGHNLGEENKGNIVQEYDPASDTWRRRADMPTARTDITAAVHNGRIYVLGGHPGLNVVESYDPATNSWRTEHELPEGRFAPAGVSTSEGIFVVGGLPNQTLAYLPQTK